MSREQLQPWLHGWNVSKSCALIQTRSTNASYTMINKASFHWSTASLVDVLVTAKKHLIAKVSLHYQTLRTPLQSAFCRHSPRPNSRGRTFTSWRIVFSLEVGRISIDGKVTIEAVTESLSECPAIVRCWISHVPTSPSAPPHARTY